MCFKTVWKGKNVTLFPTSQSRVTKFVPRAFLQKPSAKVTGSLFSFNHSKGKD